MVFAGRGGTDPLCGTRRNTPVMTNAKARGTISEEHPLNFGGFGAIHPAAIAKGGGSADLVILLGTRIGMFTGGRNSVIPPDARVIQVDIEPEEIGRNREYRARHRFGLRRVRAPGHRCAEGREVRSA